MESVPVIKDFMLKKVEVFTPELPIIEAMQRLVKHDIPEAPIIENQEWGAKLLGIISEADCLKMIINDSFYGVHQDSHPVKDYMTTELITLRENDHLSYAADLFLRHRHRAIPVVDDDNHLLGLVTRRMILKETWFISKKNKEEKKEWLSPEMKARLMETRY